MFTVEELNKLITLVSAEIMKSNLHYGVTHPNTESLYTIRDKLLEERSILNGK